MPSEIGSGGDGQQDGSPTMSARIFVDGNLVADPRYGISQSGTSWADLRVASHERIRRDDEWTSTDPQFFNVMLFGTTAERAANTLQKGDPVHVEGRVELEEFTRKDSERAAAIKVYAHSIGMRSVTGQAGVAPERAAEREQDRAQGHGTNDEPDSTAVLHHTHEATVVTGVQRNDRDLHAMLKGSGFHWSAKTSRWFLPVTQDEPTRTKHVSDLVDAAIQAGRRFDIVNQPPSVAESPDRAQVRRSTPAAPIEPTSPATAHTL